MSGRSARTTVAVSQHRTRSRLAEVGEIRGCKGSLRNKSDSPVFSEARKTGGLADVCGFHAIEISFPGGASDCRETTRTDRVDGSVLIHAVRKLWGY
jgi:hypothetical protein